ncbi:deoxyribonuclease-1-like [Haliotis rubra]|uniref:deoxyribonuclease-1-like n=1 Tax=Haliotis rubra TaxID=36100 RepID=UPI001EE5BDCB|nr:deoxyribonuclease-1-like [Haliotis rubra]
MLVTIVLLLACAPLVTPTPVSTQNPDLRVGVFNIQTFGKTKASKPEVMETIRKIISTYDVMLVQEIRQKSGECMVQLLDLLNTNNAEQFAYIASPRLGRTSYKEQYAYYYKTDKVKVVDTRLYNDSSDVFEREPYSVLVEVNTVGGGVLRMALTGVHIRPDDAVHELQAMKAVYIDTKDAFGTENVVIMGDMNADCSYVKKSEMASIKLFNDTKTFWSLISDVVDTTTSDTDCAYDRIVIAGPELESHVVAYQREDFGAEFGLTQEQQKAVSDHFPVWVTFNLEPRQ